MASKQSNVNQEWSRSIKVSELDGAWTGAIAPSHAQSYQMVRYSGEPSPLALHINVLSDKYANTGAIPNAAPAFWAGGQCPDANFDSATLTRIGCRVEWGFGACRNSITFDWISGTYAIPACEFANVSLLYYGANPTAYPGGDAVVRLGAAVVPGYCEGQVPTRTDVHALTAGVSQNFYFSPYCRAVEISADTGVDVTLSNATMYMQRVGQTTWVPAWSPVLRTPWSWPVITLDNIATIVSVAGGSAAVIEYLDFG